MIKTGDIFHAEYTNYYGTNKRHFFYCIYTQEQDIHNTLSEDIIGLLITTNEKFEHIIENKNDYNIKVKLNKRVAYVNADKIFRFNLRDKINTNKYKYKLNKKEKALIKKYYKKFIKESLRQLGE